MAALRFPERTIDAAKTASEFARIYNDKRLKAEVEEDMTTIRNMWDEGDVLFVTPFMGTGHELMYEVGFTYGGGCIFRPEELLV
jgi:hypothetical protein